MEKFYFLIYILLFLFFQKENSKKIKLKKFYKKINIENIIWNLFRIFLHVFLYLNFKLKEALFLSLFYQIILELVLKIDNYYDLFLNISGFLIGWRINNIK